MATDFKLVETFGGYHDRKDVTKLPPDVLVAPSQNVLVNSDGDKIGPRNGYTYWGAAKTYDYPVQGSFEWSTSTGTELPLRAYYNGTANVLEAYVGAAWRQVGSGYARAALEFATVWDATELIDFLVFVDGSSSLHMWTGGVATFASATANTITKQGSETWAESRFIQGGTTQVTIGGTTYTYTGGEGTTTLTGVTPDPTLAGHAAGDYAFQTVRTTATTPASGSSNDIVGVHRNQLHVADLQKRTVYVSKNTSYTDFTFTSPVRLPGEGALLTLDGLPTAFAADEDSMYVFTNDGRFKTTYTLSADLTGETLEVKRVKGSRAIGVPAQSCVAKAGDYIAYFTNDATVDFLGRGEGIDTPESRPISDPIKRLLLSYDTTVKPHLRYHENQLFVSFPSEGRVLVYEFETKKWQPPQVMPVRRFAVYGSEIHGHSSTVAESYRLFDPDAYSDLGSFPIDARAAFAYNQYGDRAARKSVSQWFTEAYKSQSTELSLTLKYEFGGGLSAVTRELGTLENRNLFYSSSDGSLGKWPLGSQPLGGLTDAIDDLPKVRAIAETTKNGLDFYELQPVYSSNQLDGRWQLAAFGGNVRLSSVAGVDIKL